MFSLNFEIKQGLSRIIEREKEIENERKPQMAKFIKF